MYKYTGAIRMQATITEPPHKCKKVATQHLAQPDLITHRFSPGEPSHNCTVVNFVITACHAVSLYPRLSLCQYGWASVDQGVSAVRVGHSGPLQSPSQKPHQGVINGCISLSLLSLSFLPRNLIPLCVGDLGRVCVADLREAGSV